MPYSNTHYGARISPKKVRPVINVIRGKRIDEADTILLMSKKRAAVFIRQALKAAISNAEEVGELGSDDKRRLHVVDARVDSGQTMKRFQPKDRGRAHKILKRSSHITVAVDVK